MQVESSSQLHSLPYLSQISRIESNKINRVFLSGLRGGVLYVQGMEVLTDLVGVQINFYANSCISNSSALFYMLV